MQLVTPGDLRDGLASFTRAMRSDFVSPNTISAYGGAVRQFGRWLVEQRYSTDVRAIERRHIEEWTNTRRTSSTWPSPPSLPTTGR